MKKKEYTAFCNASEKDLKKYLSDAQSALAHWSIDRYTKQSKNSREGQLLRKKIAVLRTYVRQKELIHGTKE